MSVTACLIILLLDDSIFIALTISSADAIESAVCDAWCMSTSADSINGTVSSVTTEGAGDGGLDRSQFDVEILNNKDVSGSGKYGAVVENVNVMKEPIHKIREDYSALVQILGRDEQRRTSGIDEDKYCFFGVFRLLI